MGGNIARRLRNLRAKPLFAIGWFVPLWLMLGLARAAILFVPFRRLAPRLGRSVPPDTAPMLLDVAAGQRAVEIGRAIRVAARYTPWLSNCFPQAIVGHLMLSLHGIPHLLFLGVRRADAGLEAHAWVMADLVPVTGREERKSYSAAACFAAGPRAADG